MIPKEIVTSDLRDLLADGVTANPTQFQYRNMSGVAWYNELPQKQKDDIQRFIWSIHRDGGGWNAETRQDLMNTFDLSINRANEIFEYFVSADSSS